MRPNTGISTFTWRGISCRVSITRDYRIQGWTVLDIRVVSPAGAPIPFAPDGYRRHGVEQAELDAAGGIDSFLTAWAERDVSTSAYAIAVAKWKQGDLFT